MATTAPSSFSSAASQGLEACCIFVEAPPTSSPAAAAVSEEASLLDTILGQGKASDPRFVCIVVRVGSKTKVSKLIKEIVPTMFESVRLAGQRQTFLHQAMQYHVMIGDGGANLICTTRRSDEKWTRLAFVCLEYVNQMWAKRRKSGALNAEAQEGFNKLVLQTLDKYSDSGMDLISQAQEGISEIQDEMTRQLELLLARGAASDGMMDAAERQRQEAETFERQSRAHLWAVRRRRCMYFIVAVVLFSAFIFISSWQICRGGDNWKELNWQICEREVQQLRDTHSLPWRP